MGKITEENRRRLEKADKYEDAEITGLLDREFTSTLNTLFDEKNMSTQQIVNITGISKGYINKLKNFDLLDIQPSRAKIINIGLALNCTEEELNDLLKSARLHPLYSRSKEEGIIIWGLLHNKSYDEILELLDEKGYGSFLEGTVKKEGNR